MKSLPRQVKEAAEQIGEQGFQVERNKDEKQDFTSMKTQRYYKALIMRLAENEALYNLSNAIDQCWKI